MVSQVDPEGLMEQSLESMEPEEVIEFYNQLLENQDHWLKLVLSWYQEIIDSYLNGDDSIKVRFDLDLAGGTCKEAEISFGEAKLAGGKLWVPGDYGTGNDLSLGHLT